MLVGWQAKLREFLKVTKKGLIVSCQSSKGEPFHGTRFMVAYALAAEIGGAVGIRTNGPKYVKAIKKAVSIPVIGIYKKRYPNYSVYITPTRNEAKLVAEAGADVIGIDATLRPRPCNTNLAQLIRFIKEDLDLPVLADVSTLDEAINAEKLGADIVATTLSGYTEYTKDKLHHGPDIELVGELVGKLKVPVIAEGRYRSPAQARKAIEMGAHAVVVGAAITSPHKIVARFVREIKKVAD